MDIQHLWHKLGARITHINAVAHSTYKGVADWYFLGNVEWPQEEGKPSKTQTNIEIPPYSVCYLDDAGKPECDVIMKAMNDYLVEKGRWHDAKHMRDGRVVHWTPNEKTGLVPL